MKLSASTIALLRCPETKQGLSIADDQLVSTINEHTDGQGISSALLREDKLVAYPVDDGYPILLIDRQLRKTDGSPW